MATESMRAVRFYAYGPPDVLEIEEVPRPAPGQGEVLVRVRAAGVNPFDCKVRSGSLKESMPLPLPHVPGSDLAGDVAALGPGVTEFSVGQPVFGRGKGTYAEYATARATALALKPAIISYDQAATIAIGGVTAWSGLFDTADLHAGQRLLVQGAAGGTGSYAVQLGRWKGAYVIGTASSRNLDAVRALGADEVVDYTATPVEAVVAPVDVVFDAVGGATMERSWRLLKPGGILVELVGAPSDEVAKAHGVRAGGIKAPSVIAGILRQLAGLIEAGSIQTEVGNVFPLERAADAQAQVETGHGRGRIVLHLAD